MYNLVYKVDGVEDTVAVLHTDNKTTATVMADEIIKGLCEKHKSSKMFHLTNIKLSNYKKYFILHKREVIK